MDKRGQKDGEGFTFSYGITEAGLLLLLESVRTNTWSNNLPGEAPCLHHSFRTIFSIIAAIRVGACVCASTVLFLAKFGGIGIGHTTSTVTCTHRHHDRRSVQQTEIFINEFSYVCRQRT